MARSPEMIELKMGFVPVNDPTAREWLDAVPEFDARVLSYPSTSMLCSYNSHPVGFLPIQKAVILESLAMDPNASDLMKSKAMSDLCKGAGLAASADGIREIYFMATDESMVKVAEKRRFERIKWPVFRVRL
jgi:hypothetical protein